VQPIGTALLIVMTPNEGTLAGIRVD